MLSAFYKISGVRVKLRSVANRTLAGQIYIVSKMIRAFVTLAMKERVFIQCLLCGQTRKAFSFSLNLHSGLLRQLFLL